MVELVAGYATGPLQRIGKMTKFVVLVDMLLRFTLNLGSISSTVLNMGTLLGLRDDTHYQLGKLDWDFSLLTDPVDGSFEVWLVQSPVAPTFQDGAASAMLAHLVQAFRIGAGTLTVAKTNQGEITDIDIGVRQEDLDDKLMIVARADNSSTYRVTGTLQIVKSFDQRSWPQSKESQQVAATF